LGASAELKNFPGYRGRSQIFTGLPGDIKNLSPVTVVSVFLDGKHRSHEGQLIPTVQQLPAFGRMQVAFFCSDQSAALQISSKSSNED